MSYTQLPTFDKEFSNGNASATTETKSRRTKYILGSVVAFTMVVGVAAITSREGNLKSSAPLNFASSGNCMKPTAGPALKGYDLVAYHSLEADAEGIKGDPQIKALWGSDGGAKYTFHFSSEENKEIFLKNPYKYLPKFGGFCSWGIAEESWWTAKTLGPRTNPNVWKVIDGDLYFFMFTDPKQRFMGELTDDDLDSSGDTKKYLADGKRRWSSWFGDEVVLNTDCFWFEKYTDKAPSTDFK